MLQKSKYASPQTTFSSFPVDGVPPPSKIMPVDKSLLSTPDPRGTPLTPSFCTALLSPSLLSFVVPLLSTSAEGDTEDELSDGNECSQTNPVQVAQSDGAGVRTSCGYPLIIWLVLYYIIFFQGVMVVSSLDIPVGEERSRAEIVL